MSHKNVTVLIQEAYSIHSIGEIYLSNELFLAITPKIIGSPYLDLPSFTASHYQIQVFVVIHCSQIFFMLSRLVSLD